MSREIQCVDLLLGWVVSTCDGPVLARFWESWESLQEIPFPCPDHDCSEVFANLIRRATGILTTLRDRTLVHPVKILPDFLAADLVKGQSFAPLLPFFHRGGVRLRRSQGCCPCTKVIGHHCFEIRRHLLTAGGQQQRYHGRLVAARSDEVRAVPGLPRSVLINLFSHAVIRRSDDVLHRHTRRPHWASRSCGVLRFARISTLNGATSSPRSLPTFDDVRGGHAVNGCCRDLAVAARASNRVANQTISRRVRHSGGADGCYGSRYVSPASNTVVSACSSPVSRSSA
jgi:hypothetical protein